MGGLLVERGSLSPTDLLDAVVQAGTDGAPLDSTLVAQGLVTPEALLESQARRHGMLQIGRDAHPAQAALAALVPPETCLAARAVPWTTIGDTLVVACAAPGGSATLRPLLDPVWPRVIEALCLEADIEAELAARHGAYLARRAETSVPLDESCRDLNLATSRRRLWAAALALLCTALLVLRPNLFFAAAVVLAVAGMGAGLALKLAALCASLIARPAPAPVAPPPLAQRPVVTLLVPLFRETRIVDDLIRRLGRLTYPAALRDVIFVTEARDAAMRRALESRELPSWLRVIEVPDGPITTKPRALNYALGFARGDIVGVLDAEDAPAPNQLDRVTQAFAAAPAEVACLQGMLDFYNPHANWLSRCFAIEYATWFRVMLPGLAALGLAIPLGGTTVYFRRQALDAVGGWDAHNVTEDADLGIRLARHGFRTEMLPTVTREEANNRLWPWVRQRSRWLKGYMKTWAVHAKRPRALWRDLGPWRFAGFHALFLSAVLPALLQPVLWSFWGTLAGFPPPLLPEASGAAVRMLCILFLLAEGTTALTALVAVARAPHRGLMVWVPSLALYFPLTVAAGYKAAWELGTRPFYWDKTEHGASPPDSVEADRPEG
ncbi:glycosyl transferase [Roseivivax isoporae LMG 25204]|uniref:Glycosyl transferase n=1 Tax=Roseivivax isoporae LMG 25204 TaxID=1449351 RepID=X7F647_9RHOB|nr:glycosyl transferase [Roseivivax isoporae LMG 25204]